jgi:threonine/homoserine/homoserine lactone efflux protein
MDTLLLKGLILGFSIAAPVGPIGVLCIRRTLANGRLAGFISGLGAASADMCYGSVAAFGLSAISGFLIGQQFWMRLIGGAFLLYLGVQTFRSKPAAVAATARNGGLVAAYLSTLLLTLTNPMTIISFAAVFAGLGFVNAANVPAGSNYSAAIQLVSGVFLGSATWWLTLSTSVGILHERFNNIVLVWVNYVSGFIIGGFGVFALVALLP